MPTAFSDTTAGKVFNFVIGREKKKHSHGDPTRDWNSGDRVLVAKYEYHIRPPKRFEVPVFKYPQEPYHASDKTAMNYIKRLCGLPGETIAIYKGDLYVTESLTYPGRPRPERQL